MEKAGLSTYEDRQITKELKVMDAKEKEYSQAIGYEISPNQDIYNEKEAGEEFDGWASTSDFARLQSIEVESFSAFPLSPRRNPVPKRVDVDLTVKHTRAARVINWVDPIDKVVF